MFTVHGWYSDKCPVESSNGGGGGGKSSNNKTIVCTTRTFRCRIQKITGAVVSTTRWQIAVHSALSRRVDEVAIDQTVAIPDLPTDLNVAVGHMLIGRFAVRFRNQILNTRVRCGFWGVTARRGRPYVRILEVTFSGEI